jgi:hypothetical protein
MKSVFFLLLVIGHKRRWNTLCIVWQCSFYFYSFFLLLSFLF